MKKIQKNIIILIILSIILGGFICLIIQKMETFSMLKNFENTNILDFKSVQIYDSHKKEYKLGKKQIRELKNVILLKTNTFSKSAGIVYDISIYCTFMTNKGKEYKFWLTKEKGSKDVHVFFKSNKVSYYLNGTDNNKFLDYIYYCFFLGIQCEDQRWMR